LTKSQRIYYINRRKMNKNKHLAYLLMPFICAGLLSGQSLVELAKKEKARREKAKGKKILVVTNADLNKKRIKRIKPAVPAQKANKEESAEAPASNKVPVQLSRNSNSKETPEEKTAKIAKLQDDWEKAEDNVGQLTQKMNMLWQAYYSLADSMRKNLLQQQISLTHLALLKARQDAGQLKTQLDELKKK